MRLAAFESRSGTRRSDLEKFDYLARLNHKRINYAIHSLIGGEKVIHAIEGLIRNDKYGCVWDYIPLNKIITISLTEIDGNLLMTLSKKLVSIWKSFVIVPCLLVLLSACQLSRLDTAPADATETLLPDQVSGADISDLRSFSSASIIDTEEYVIREQLMLVNEGPGEPSRQNLWIALITDVYPYQTISKMEITPENYRIFTDEYGNQIAEFEFSGMPAGTEIKVQIDYLVSVNRLAYDLSACEGELPDIFTQPELHIESNNPQIIALADLLLEGRPTVCAQVRAFYDYIGDNLVYSYNGNDWGAQAALGEMGADCTEYASLMIALSRAAGIPARYMEGLWYQAEPADELARTEHAWLEVYLPDAGWTPMDPTLGRSSLFREQHFAAYTPDHIIVTRGRHPSALRGASYFSHIYWPGKSAVIKIRDFGWSITPRE